MKKLFRPVINFLKKTDHAMWLFCLLASALGILMLYSIVATGLISNDRVLTVQIIAVILGIVAAVAISSIHYHTLAKLWVIYVPLAILLVLLTFTPLGIEREGTGNRAWLSLGITDFQPSELLKLAFIFTFAIHLSKIDNINNLKNLSLLCLHALIPIGLIVLQGDFGSALVFVFIFICMLFVAGLSFKIIIPAVCILAATFPLVWFFLLQDKHRNRFLIAMHPEQDILGIGGQQYYGRIALGSGGLFGKGLFSNKLIYVYEMYNDFIFAHIGQTLGFVGCVATVLLLCCIAWRILWTAKRSKDALGSYLCIGVFAILVFQSIINIGMVLCVLPVIGVTLPFISSGGTSAVTMYLSIAIVISVYAHNQKSEFD